MDKELRKLTNALRAEKCPPRVRQRIHARIEEEKESRRSAWWTFAGVSGFASLIICMGTLLWLVNRPVERPTPDSPVTLQTETEQVAREAFLSLAYVGAVLLESGRQTESHLLQEANEPVKTSYQDIRNYIIKNM